MRKLLGLLVVMLVTWGGGGAAWAQSPDLSRITGPSPFPPNCGGASQGGTLYRNAEVEPFVDTNPLNPRNLVAVWQQDRWSNGGARGDLTGISFDRGQTWRRPDSPPFTRCAGGNPRNGGDYDRASDPWVSFGANGVAHQIALAISDDQSISAILHSRSTDGGRTWGRIHTLQRDTTAALFNDKETITADPRNGRFVYAVWDRLQTENPDDPASDFSGDTLFTRSTNGGRTWEPTRTILDFPDNSNTQTIGNQIVVLGDGTLVNTFNLIEEGFPLVAIQRSEDRGRTWSDPIVVDVLFGSAAQGQGVIDPTDNAPVRTGDILPEVGADPRRGSETLHIAWQDIRFTLAAPLPYVNDQIVISSSTDGGLSWSDPRRVSENKLTQAFTGSVEVDERGAVGVTYYDFTNDTEGGRSTRTTGSPRPETATPASRPGRGSRDARSTCAARRSQTGTSLATTRGSRRQAVASSPSS
jgi:hypothetical protein